MCAAGCEPPQPPEPEAQSVRPARVYLVQDQVQTLRYEFVARVEAVQSIDMTFQVSGPLAQLPIREGQTIPQGNLIAALDPTDFDLAVREAQVQLQLAKQDLERKQRILRERGIARSVVDDARALYELRQVRLEKARESLADSRLYAPFEAYVARRYVDNRVNITAGQKVAQIYDLSTLLIVASLPESLVATASTEQVVNLQATFDFAPDEVFDLSIHENRGEADPVAQTYEVSFAMPRPQTWNILPGMSATFIAELRDPNAERVATRVPTNALVGDGAGSGFFVWVFDPQTLYVERRPVTVGKPLRQGIEIVAGVKAGDLVVTSGASQLQEGMQIRMLGDPVTAL